MENIELSLDNVHKIIISESLVKIIYSDNTTMTINKDKNIILSSGFVGGSEQPLVDHCI
jgi:hypothetical protein